MTAQSRTALITGASHNMGRAIALRMARRGINVALNARNLSNDLRAVAEEATTYGVQAICLPGDIANPDEITQIVASVEAQLGGVDIYVNTPAARPATPFLEISQQEWTDVLNLNLGALFVGAQRVLPHMIDKGWGRIVAFSGAATFFGAPRRAHVMASKSGVHGLIRSVALEFANTGVTANTIVPGRFATERTDRWVLANTTVPAETGTSPLSAPVGREGQPEEVAALCDFICSDEAGYITGQSLHINGGAYVT